MWKNIIFVIDIEKNIFLSFWRERRLETVYDEQNCNNKKIKLQHLVKCLVDTYCGILNFVKVYIILHGIV